MSDLPMIGQATQREQEFMDYLGNCIADYIEINKSERRELICGLFQMLYIVFDKQTHFDLEGKLKEVDTFCHFMKEKILGRLNAQVD